MICATRNVPDDQRSIVEKRFASLFVIGPHIDLRAVLVSFDGLDGPETTNGTRMAMVLPDSAFLRLFDGFEVVARDTLPNKAALLRGDQNEFLKHFRFPVSEMV